MNETATGIEPGLHIRLGLTDGELDDVRDVLGREPNEIELSMYSIMWSEHCSYKSSRIHLSRLPSTAPWVIVGPGENAGVVDIGDGLAAVLRIESHNHPSAVEPHQGAATGVGGIIRDILTMGARPIALADPLRFGPVKQPLSGESDSVELERNRFLTRGVVSGISSYGNAVGVPTVAGEIDFAPCYSGNPLVNVFCLGTMPIDHLVLAKAGSEGDLALLLGSTTGRDGIGGVSVLASAGFGGDADDSKRPSVQVGDPLEEKRLIEACLELFESKVVVGIQDLGGAGLTCATSEIAANSGMGMVVDIAQVPKREAGMVAAEVMASESQERMLAIVSPNDLERASQICERWGVTASVVGKVVDGDALTIVSGGGGEVGRQDENAEALARVPAASLSEGPKYKRPLERPESLDEANADDPRRLGSGPRAEEALLTLLADPSIGDTSWIWRQYDHQLFLNTVVGPGRDATVLRVKGTSRALAISCDGNARFCELDPRRGASLTVAEACRNVSVVGARPIALVDCLNLGNPEHASVIWQLSEVVDGIAEACEAFDLPVVGGNVSLYNETAGSDIWPTPIVAVLGLIDRLEAPPIPMGWAEEGLAVYLLGETRAELGGSAWAHVLFSHLGGMPPAIDLAAAANFHHLLRLISSPTDTGDPPVASSIHDCSLGGLAVALAESAIESGIGVSGEVSVANMSLDDHEFLFSESPSRAVVSVHPEQEAALLAAAHHHGVPAVALGQTSGSRLDLEIIDLGVSDAAAAWRNALPNSLGIKGRD